MGFLFSKVIHICKAPMLIKKSIATNSARNHSELFMDLVFVVVLQYQRSTRLLNVVSHVIKLESGQSIKSYKSLTFAFHVNFDAGIELCSMNKAFQK